MQHFGPCLALNNLSQRSRRGYYPPISPFAMQDKAAARHEQRERGENNWSFCIYDRWMSVRDDNNTNSVSLCDFCCSIGGNYAYLVRMS